MNKPTPFGRRALLALALAGAVAAQAQPARQPADPALLRELERDIWQPFVAAQAASDVEAYIALHSPSLVRASADARQVQTHADWAAHTRALWKSMTERGRRAEISFRFIERLAAADAASERGVYALTLHGAPGGPRSFHGQFHVISRKEGGRWRIVVDYDSSEGGRIDAAAFQAAFAAEDHARY